MQYSYCNDGVHIAGVGLAAYITRARVEALRDDFAVDVERKRGHALLDMGNPGESTEWLNSIVGTLWTLINPDLFIAILDL